MSTWFRTRTTSRGTEETEARLSDLYGRVDLHGGASGMVDEHVGDQHFGIDQVRIRGAYDSETEVDQAFCVILPSAGGSRWETGRTSGALERSPVLIQPGQRYRTRIVDLEATTILLAAAPLQEAARVLQGDDRLRLRFDPDPRPVSARAGVGWAAAMRFAVATMTDAVESDLVRSAAHRLLTVTTLEAFRLVGESAARSESAVALLRSYHRAVEFMEAHASLPVSLLDVAHAAGTTDAGLRDAFRAHSLRGRTAAQHLRDVRLSAAHEDLVQADPTRGATVGAIARRWGFPHPGRFAEHYRAAYGRNPRWTLER